MGKLGQPGFRVIPFGVRTARDVTLHRRFERQECVEDLRVTLRIGPKPGDAGPFLAQSFLVRIAVLGNQSVNTFGVVQHQTETDRRTIIVNIKAVTIDLEFDEKILDYLCELIECV